MSLQFRNLKSHLLNLEDKITVGKLSGCRVCDVIPDHYEYLIWADKAGIMKFTKMVVETIQEHAGYKYQQRHYDEEIAPWREQSDKTQTVYEVISREGYYDTFDDDVPF